MKQIDFQMGRSYKFRGDVDHSFYKKKKIVNTKDHIDPKKETKDQKEKKEHDQYQQYSGWEEEGDFEKFDRKRW